MRRAYIAFGANLGTPRAMLMDVVGALAGEGVVVDDVSGLYRSEAWPAGSGAPEYRNAVLSVRAERSPEDLMSLLLDVERRLGRVRSEPNAPRIIDLDLIDVPGVRMATEHLVLPHPRAAERDFVMLPLREVAPGHVLS